VIIWIAFYSIKLKEKKQNTSQTLLYVYKDCEATLYIRRL